MDGNIIVVTGISEDTEPPVFVRTVETRRRAGRGEWRFLPPMITARGNPAAAAVDGMVYVAGGANNGFRDEVERFDPRAETWTSVAPLPEKRAAPAGAGLNGLLYVAGGTVPKGADGEENTDSVIVFNPAKPEPGWREVAPMLDTRARHKLIAVDGHLYAIGGEDDDFDTRSSAERYDLGTNTWTRIAPMHESRAFFGIAAVRHDIAVVGGYTQVGDRTTFLQTTEIYDVSRDRWRTLETLLPQRRVSLFAATEPDGSLLAIGGVVFDGDGNPTVTDEVLALSRH